MVIFRVSRVVWSNVAFIGLGQMGSRMAGHLISNHSVKVFDFNIDAVSQAAQRGAIACSSVAEAVTGADFVVTMLDRASSVESVIKTICDVPSASSPENVDAVTPGVLHARLHEKNSTWALLNAPVSGGVKGAEVGTLTFMVGGPVDLFTKAKTFLTPMGPNVIHCGVEPGAGAVVKLCNNAILASHMIAVAEAMLIGVKLGVSEHTLKNIFSTSTARCWSVDTNNPFPGVIPGTPACNNWQGGFGSKLMLKDLKLAVDAAKTAGQPTKALQGAVEMYSTIADGELGNSDFGVVLKYLDQKSTKPVLE